MTLSDPPPSLLDVFLKEAEEEDVGFHFVLKSFWMSRSSKEKLN